MTPELKAAIQEIIEEMNSEKHDFKNQINPRPFDSFERQAGRVDCIDDYIDKLEELLFIS